MSEKEFESSGESLSEKESDTTQHPRSSPVQIFQSRGSSKRRSSESEPTEVELLSKRQRRTEKETSPRILPDIESLRLSMDAQDNLGNLLGGQVLKKTPALRE